MWFSAIIMNQVMWFTGNKWEQRELHQSHKKYIKCFLPLCFLKFTQHIKIIYVCTYIYYDIHMIEIDRDRE